MATKTNPYSEDTAADRLSIVTEYRRTQERERFRIELASPEDPRLEAMAEDILRAQDVEKDLRSEAEKAAKAAKAV